MFFEGLAIAIGVKSGFKLLKRHVKNHKTKRIVKEVRNNPEVQQLVLNEDPMLLTKDEVVTLQIMGATEILSAAQDRAESELGQKLKVVRDFQKECGA
jgi:hypothetical protein